MAWGLMILILVLTCSKVDVTNSSENESTASSSGPPNILLIIADDMGLDATPGYEVGIIKPHMPNLLELQASGITYDNVWSSPMCAPTRATIITGKYGIHNGVLNTSNAGTLPVSEKTIQAYLDEQLGKVYAHALIGKWHLSNNENNRPNQMGIDHFAGLIPGTLPDYNRWELTVNGQTTTSNEYVTTKFTDFAIDWIKRQEKPWFCWLAYTAPHSPFHLPPTEMHTQNSLTNDAASVKANPSPYFRAMIESIDYEMGRLLNQIPEAERNNTIVIFVGDNGTPAKVIQSPFLSNRSKGSLHQGGIQIPLVVSGAGVSREGERDKRLIHTADLFATIAQVAGIKTADYQDSQSFYASFTDMESSARTYNYSEILDLQKPAKSGYAVRNERYKLIVLDNGSSLFYDLQSDPYENDNRINQNLSAAQQSALESLQAEATRIRISALP